MPLLTLRQNYWSQNPYDAILLTKEELQDQNTYTQVLQWQEAYDYSQVEEGILPKLYYKDTKTLLPYQEDIYIETAEGLTVEELEVEQEASYITGRIIINNPKGLQITKIAIEDMETEIQKQSIIEEKTYIDFRATPTRYYDSYKLYEIEYEEEGQVKTKEVGLRINTPFYKELYPSGF